MGAPSKSYQQNIDHAVAGAFSSFLTRFACQPLDVLKIRFQLQVEPITNHQYSKYRSLSQAFLLILKEEGIYALWKGHVPAQLLSIVYGMSQFYSYNIFMKASHKFPLLNDWKYSRTFLAGAGAASISTILSFPLDTIRTRLVAQSKTHQVYKGICHSCSSILRYESPRVFFYGLLPTLIQIAPYSGLQFALYRIFSDIHKRYYNETSISLSNSMVAGSAAGVLAKTAFYPLDLSKKRLQIQGFEHGRKGFGTFFQCKGLLDCLRVTVKVEGVKGLFKGLVPSQLKAGVTTALHFTVYEQTLKAIEAQRRYRSEK